MGRSLEGQRDSSRFHFVKRSCSQILSITALDAWHWLSRVEPGKRCVWQGSVGSPSVLSYPLYLATASHVLLMGQIIPLGSEFFTQHRAKTGVQSAHSDPLWPLNLLLKHSELPIQGWLANNCFPELPEAILFSTLCPFCCFRAMLRSMLSWTPLTSSLHQAIVSTMRNWHPTPRSRPGWGMPTQFSSLISPRYGWNPKYPSKRSTHGESSVSPNASSIWHF